MTQAFNRRSVLRAGVGALAGVSLLRHAEAAVSRATTTALSERLALITGVGGNVVALRSDEGVLLVDTGLAAQTRALQSQVKSFGAGRPVSTVINTHWHAAQTGGNEVFGKAGAKIIAHAKTRQRLATDQYLPQEDRYLKARSAPAIPTKVFYLGSEQLVFGGENIEYGYLLEAHTDGDLYVLFRDSNVLVVGDAAAPSTDPELAWFEGGWLGGRVDALSKLLTVGNGQTQIVTSMGAPVSRAELALERDALDTVFTRLSEALRKGLTTEDMQKANILDGLPRSWADPDKFIYDAHKGMWAHHNTLSHQIV